ncbi:hypothetical protein KBY84_07205 [Cyanobium sp. N.Huapi 1H5]|uniref:hypothetical protein n=1 Tax=Cyanobium sp. N.Huapi 1H5 TaxID=2823719 RepID=UPI0020CCAA2D|nr:hypothetical protein [Cyanobium sp. N.Huapi 1H5]MCP9837281.1 hypothetical protein [Cyanobium sp. N.Huapi 1H5]
MNVAKCSPEAITELLRNPLPLRLARGEDLNVLRPVQYLGNKQRSLGVILSAIEDLVSQGDAVFDLFSGTSVVSQGLTALGLKVSAVDVSTACCAMAQATLGVGRSNWMGSPSEMISSWQQASASPYEELTSKFAPWIGLEELALQARDGKALISAGQRVPQVWRTEGAESNLLRLFSTWNDAALLGSQRSLALLSPVVAGSYLGIEQAVTVDARRKAITEMVERGEIDGWQSSVMITALLAATSKAAYSPGKHFAQPHRTDASKNLNFHSGRALADRSVDIATTAEEFVRLLFRRPRPEQASEVLQMPVNEINADELKSRNVHLVYADPPYTAQQYSRFYHVLDTLALGVPHPLQIYRGAVTSGLYPNGRYFSPFCSKRQATPAFEELATTCYDAGATMVLSYSTSANGSTGNQRMISLDELCKIFFEVYGSAAVEVRELAHGYRQFNSGDSARPSRDDPEVLLIAHAA